MDKLRSLRRCIPRKADYPFGVALEINGKNRVFLECIRPGWDVGIEWCFGSLYFSFLKVALIFIFNY
jgi:hypothetical protein